MPWKLILILIIFGLFIAFTGFNLENASVISFGFVVLDRVPIFLSLSVAFLAGAFYYSLYHFQGKAEEAWWNRGLWFTLG